LPQEAVELMEGAMPARLRTFIGSILLVALVVTYALVASAVAVARLGEASAWTQLAFFLFSGLLWVLPAMAIVSWMSKSAKARRR
jgi:hypothetical protein